MTGISIKDKTVLVTGSNRGIGKSFVLQALAMGAKKVYATARNESTLAELVAMKWFPSLISMYILEILPGSER